MFIIFFLFLVSTFYFYFLLLMAWQFVTRHPPLATHYPPPVTRHLRKSPAANFPIILGSIIIRPL